MPSRDKHILLRVSNDERERLKTACRYMDVPMSEYVRTAVKMRLDADLQREREERELMRLRQTDPDLTAIDVKRIMESIDERRARLA